MGLIEKLKDIKIIKENIKDAILEKGVAVENATPFKDYADKIKNLQTGEEFVIDNVKYLFRQNRRNSCLKTLIKHIDWTQITNISDMFSDCDELTEIDLSSFDTSNVTNMSMVFMGCSSLKELNFININTKKTLDMTLIFAYCEELTQIINLDISNVLFLDNSFDDCINLNILDFTGTTNVLSNFDISTTGLNRDGLMNMLATLPELDHTKTITIGSEKLILLSDEDIAGFTQKGYSLA